MSQEIKLTRAQQKYFEGYVKDMLAMVLKEATTDTDTESLLSLIDYKEYGKNFGIAVLSNGASYSDIKAAHKAYSDPAVIRASIAIEEAISQTLPSADDLVNIQFMAGFLTSGAYKGTDLLDVLADQSPEIQEASIAKLYAQSKKS